MANAQSEVASIIGRITAKHTLWNAPVFNDNFQLAGEKGAITGSNLPESPLLTTQLLPDIRGYKEFIDELAKFNTPGKLQNLRLTSADIVRANDRRKTLERAKQLLQIVDGLQTDTGYLAQATEILPTGDDWQQDAATTRNELLLAVRRFGRGETGKEALQPFTSRLTALRKAYVDRYADAHQLARLDASGDERIKKLRVDARVHGMKELESLPLLVKNKGDLQGWQMALANLKVCLEFHPGMLDTQPKCNCGFTPSQTVASSTAKATLEHLDQRLDTLSESWRKAVREGLDSEIAQQSLAGMTADERKPINAFLALGENEPSVPTGFVKAATVALTGIESVAIESEHLLDALRAGGMPCTVDQLERRFEAYVSETLRNHTRQKTRVTIPTSISH